MAGVDQTSFQNPYASLYAQQYAGAGLNDDFMYNATIAQPQAGAQNPAFTGLYSMYNQAQNQDTFEKQGSSGLSTGLKIGAVGGIGATAGAYYFGGDRLKINPYIDGKYQDSFLRTLEDPKAVETEVTRLVDAEKAKILEGKKVTNIHQFNAIKEYGNTGVKPENVTLPKGIKTPEQAKALAEEIEKGFKGIKVDELTETARRTVTLEGSTAHLNNLNNRLATLGDLKEVTNEQLVKHIQDNAKLYGITETEEAAIKAAAERKAALGVEGLTAETKGLIETQKGTIGQIRSNIIRDNKLGTYFDTAANTVREGAPKSLTKAVRNFKLTKAGKVGACVAAAGVVLGLLFGGSKS